MKIVIPSARTTEQGHSKFVVYTVHVFDGSSSCSAANGGGTTGSSSRPKLERRYRDFHALHKSLRRLYPSIEFADFPPKKIRHLNEKVTQERRVSLQAWLQSAVDTLLAKDEFLPACVQEFLDLDKHNIAALLNDDDFLLGGSSGSLTPGCGVGGSSPGAIGEHQPILCFIDEPFKEQDSPTLPNIIVDATLDAIY